MTAVLNIENSNLMNANNLVNNINIYRYNFDEKFMEDLTTFAKIHQYDDRKIYKESWKVWIEENQDSIKKEEYRLKELGYEGDVIDKMYKAARYYFRKKPQVKVDPKKRRKYIAMDQEVIVNMDQHIIRNMSNKEYTPSNGYSEFCKLNVEMIKIEIKRMIELGIATEDISHKFKKTYKNRYFIISRNLNCDDKDDNMSDVSDTSYMTCISDFP